MNTFGARFSNYQLETLNVRYILILVLHRPISDMQNEYKI